MPHRTVPVFVTEGNEHRHPHTAHTETGDTYNIFVIDVKARAGAYGNPDYVSRRMQASVTDAP